MTEQNLRILVVEDKPKNIEAAKILLSGNELRLAQTYDQAITRINEGKLDVVLTDMMFPPGNLPSLPSRMDVDSPQPLGYAVALYAARLSHSVPLIGIVTDLNHHSNVIGATFDNFYSPDRSMGDESRKSAIPAGEMFLGGFRSTYGGEEHVNMARPVFRVNNSYLAMFDERYAEETVCLHQGAVMPQDELSKQIGWDASESCKVKNWKKVLEDLLSIRSSQ